MPSERWIAPRLLAPLGGRHRGRSSAGTKPLPCGTPSRCRGARVKMSCCSAKQISEAGRFSHEMGAGPRARGRSSWFMGAGWVVVVGRVECVRPWKTLTRVRRGSPDISLLHGLIVATGCPANPLRRSFTRPSTCASLREGLASPHRAHFDADAGAAVSSGERVTRGERRRRIASKLNHYLWNEMAWVGLA